MKHLKLLHTILITVQRDATQSSLFIILQVNSPCFGCQPHPSSGVHKTVTTVSGTSNVFFVQLPPSNVGRYWYRLAMHGTINIKCARSFGGTCKIVVFGFTTTCSFGGSCCPLLRIVYLLSNENKQNAHIVDLYYIIVSQVTVQDT